MLPVPEQPKVLTWPLTLSAIRTWTNVSQTQEGPRPLEVVWLSVLRPDSLCFGFGTPVLHGRGWGAVGSELLQPLAPRGWPGEAKVAIDVGWAWDGPGIRLLASIREPITPVQTQTMGPTACTHAGWACKVRGDQTSTSTPQQRQPLICAFPTVP